MAKYSNWYLVASRLESCPEKEQREVTDALDLVESDPLGGCGMIPIRKMRGVPVDPLFLAELPHGWVLTYAPSLGRPGMGDEHIEILAFTKLDG